MRRPAANDPQPHPAAARHDAHRRACRHWLPNVLAAAVVITWFGAIDSHASGDIADEGAARIEQLLHELSLDFQEPSRPA